MISLQQQYGPRKSEVSDFDDVLITDEAVTCGEVTVYEALTLEVRHRRTHLVTHLYQHVCVGQQAGPATAQVL